MKDKNLTKHFLLASDFDQTLSFNDSGIVLSELLGVSDFQEKVAGLSHINLVQQGGELAYLLLHDPEYRRVRRDLNVSEAAEVLHTSQPGVSKQIRALESVGMDTDVERRATVIFNLDGSELSFEGRTITFPEHVAEELEFVASVEEKEVIFSPLPMRL